MEPKPSFGGVLRRLRQAAGLSQEELAERAGLTPAAVGMLERGERRRPHPRTLQALADALGLAPAERTALFMITPQRTATGDSEGSDRPGHWALTASAGWAGPPVPLTSLVGRERDAAIVSGLLQGGGARMVTLTGPGGVGKTRLAIEVASFLGSSFEAGVAWVDLAPVREPGLVLPAIAHALRLTERPDQDVAALLEGYLEHRRGLLVLDNFDHLLAAAPPVLALLERCPRLAVLATSREALRVRGEQEIQVPPLALPDPGEASSAESVARAAAADLFLQRVRAVRPGFTLTDAEAPRIAAICARLDGVPLALELAAAQVKYMSPAALHERLRSRLDLLERGPRDLPSRQQSLRATMAWSHELLTVREQDLFRRLAVFVGGFTLEAVQAVCGVDGDPPALVARTLAALVDKSVVQTLADPGGEVKFAMLETIREYARERLVGSGEETLLADRHAGYFCDLVEAIEPYLTSASPGKWLSRLDAEVANVRAALGWTTTRGDPCIGLRLAGAVARFWVLRGYFGEGTHWTDLLLALPATPCGAGARAGALLGAAALAWKRGDHAVARRYAEESVLLRRGLDDRRRLAFSLAMAGLICTSQADLESAIRIQEECLALFQEQGDPWGIAYARANLGDTLLQQGDLAGAHRHYTEGLEYFTQIGDPWGQGIVLHALGNVAWARGDAAVARTRYDACVAHYRSIGNTENVARGLIGAAAAALTLGEVDEAQRLLGESITIWRNLGSSEGAAVCLAGLASVQAERGRFSAAARLFGAAEALGRGRPSPYLVDAGLFSHHLGETQEHLGATSFARARSEGEGMTLEEAIAYALQEHSI